MDYFCDNRAGAVLSALVFFILPFTVLADAENPVKLWTVEGLANPESVVFDNNHKVLYVSNVNGGPTDKDGNGLYIQGVKGRQNHQAALG